jgi:hypothetical protein
MYENEYFFIKRPGSSSRVPFLSPDLKTSNRHFRFEALPLGQAPLKFFNENRAQNRLEGFASKTFDIMFDGTDLVVRDRVREKLLDYEIPNLHIYPSVYVDDKDQWHEDFWYLTFTERFDCWDRRTSNYDQEDPPIRLGGFEYHQVYSCRFDEELMKKTPLDQRLLFKIGGTLDAYIVAHESIIGKVFGAPGDNGADYIRISDY